MSISQTQHEIKERKKQMIQNKEKGQENVEMDSLNSLGTSHISIVDSRFEENMQEQISAFNSKIKSLKIKKWDNVEPNQSENESEKMKGEPIISHKIDKQQQQLTTFRKNVENVFQLVENYDVKLRCENLIHERFMVAIQGVRSGERVEQFKCCKCGLDGSCYVKEEKGYMRCYSKTCKYNICLMCSLACSQPSIIPLIFKLPLCKDWIVPQGFKSKNNAFICSSSLMSSFKNVPKDWAKCENGYDGSKKEADDHDHIQCFEARNSEFQLCIKCTLKWLKFKFDPNLNYDEFGDIYKKQKLNQNLNPIKIIDIQQDNKNIMKYNNEEIQEYFKNKFIKEVVQERQVSHNFLKIGGYIPEEADFDYRCRILDDSFNRENINFIGKTKVQSKQMRFIEYQNQYWTAVLTQESLENKDEEICFIKTLRIYSSVSNKLKKQILLEQTPFIPKYFDYQFASFLQKEECIYYFKRVWNQEITKESQVREIVIKSGLVQKTKEQYKVSSKVEIPSINENPFYEDEQSKKLLEEQVINQNSRNFSGDSDSFVREEPQNLSPIEQPLNMQIKGLHSYSKKSMSSFFINNESIKLSDRDISKSHLQLFRFNLISDEEVPILDYRIYEREELLSPFFGKPFGDQFIVYMEKKGKFYNKEIFQDQTQALHRTEICWQEMSKGGNLQLGYIIIDVNLSKVVFNKGKIEVCIRQAIIEEILIPEKKLETESLLYPTEALIGYQELDESEQLFFKQQFFILQSYQATTNYQDPLSPTILQNKNQISKQQKTNNLIDGLKIALDNAKIKLISKNCFKIFKMDNIDEPIAMISKINNIHEVTDFPISSFLFTQLLTKDVGELKVDNLQKRKSFILENMFRTQMTMRQKEPEKEMNNVNKEYVFVMTDDKIYHLNYKDDYFQNEEQLKKNLQVFDQYVINVDAAQNVQTIEIKDLCLPKQVSSKPFKQYLLVDHKNKKFTPIYPNFKQQHTTIEVSHDTGEKKIISIHDKISNIALNKFAGNLTDFQIITSDKSDDNIIHYKISVRQSGELIHVLSPFLKKKLLPQINSNMIFHLMHTRRRTTLYIIDQSMNEINYLNFELPHQLGQIITNVEQSKDLSEYSYNNNQKINKKICNLQRNLLEQGILKRYQTLHINSSHQNIICSESSIFGYQEQVDTEQSKIELQLNNNRGNFILLERPNHGGEYSKMKLIEKSLLKYRLKYVMRCRSENFYLFVFKFGGIPLFIKKTYKEVDSLTKPNNKQELINKSTQIMIFEKMDNNKNFKLEQLNIKEYLENHNQSRFQNYLVHLESVIDMRYKSPFIVMIYTDQTGIDNQTMIFFNFDQHYFIKQCIEPNNNCKKDLYAQDIAILRTSDREQYKENNNLFITSFQYVYAFDGQGDRFQITEVVLIEKLDNHVLKKENLSIRILGMKEILASQKQREIFQCAYFKAIPLYSNQGLTLKGMQLIINNNMDNSDGHMVINFTNLKFDKTQFKYETNLMYFDIKKIFCGNDAKRYYLVANANIKIKQILEYDLNAFELTYLLENIISNLYHMVPFQFDTMILQNNQLNIDQINCFQSQEIFGGKSLCDLYIKNPSKVRLALKYFENEYQSDFHQSIIQLHVEEVQLNFKQKLIECQFLKVNQFLTFDFNFVSQIERAFQLKQLKSAELIVNFILNSKSISQQKEILIQIMPSILESVNLDICFMKFFDFPQDCDQEFCHIESTIKDIDNIPKFSEKQNEYLQIPLLLDSKNTQDDVVHFINKNRDNNQKVKSEKSEKVNNDAIIYDIQHSFIDFRHLILGKKMKHINKLSNDKEDQKFVFDDYFLSNLISKSKCNETLFSQESIQRIIDSHFEFTRPKLITLMLIYTFGFYVPFIFTLFFKKIDQNFFRILKYMIYAVGCFTQLFFFGNELIQLKYKKKTYFKDNFWNLIEFSQFFFYVAYIVQEIQNTIDGKSSENIPDVNDDDSLDDGSGGDDTLRRFLKSGGRGGGGGGGGGATHNTNLANSIYVHKATIMDVESFNVIIIILLLVIGGFVKILYFLRLFQTYGKFVEMIGETIKSLIPFIVYFMMWIGVFTVLFHALQVEVPDDSYPGLSPIYRKIIQTYSNSIGNIAPPTYVSLHLYLYNTDDYESLRFYQAHCIIAIIWFVWLSNQFFNLIIMLNFLIAVISEVYERVVANQEQVIYKHKAELNNEFFMIRKFLNMCQPYSIIAFSIDQNVIYDKNKEQHGFVNQIKQFTQDQNSVLQGKLDKIQKVVEQENEQQTNFQLNIKKMLGSQLKMISENEKCMSLIREGMSDIGARISSK